MFDSVFESCMLIDIGLSISDCASWVQAWGSIFAIFVAVLVPFLTRHADEIKEEQKKRSLALTASVEIQMHVNHALVALKSMNKLLNISEGEDFSIANIQMTADRLSSIVRPPASSIELIRQVNPRIALMLSMLYGEVDDVVKSLSSIKNDSFGSRHSFEYTRYFKVITSKIQSGFEDIFKQLEGLVEKTKI